MADDSCVIIDVKSSDKADASCIIIDDDEVSPKKRSFDWDDDVDDLEQFEKLQADLAMLDSNHGRPKPKSPRKTKDIQKLEINKKNIQVVRENQAASRATENCIAIIDQNVLELINDRHGDFVKTLFDENNCRYRLSQSINLPSSITWVRIRKEAVQNRADESFSSSQPATFSLDASLCVREFESLEPHISIVLSAEDFIEKLESSSDSNSRTLLDDFIEQIKLKSNAIRITIIVFNLAAHFKRARQRKDREFNLRFKEKFGGPITSRNESNPCDLNKDGSIRDFGDLRKVKNKLIFRQNKLHPDWRIGLWFLDNTDDVVQAICKQTVSIAKAPHKERAKRQDGIDWAIDADRATRPVDPGNSEEDLKILWINQLQQFSTITPQIAQSIAMKYPRPMSLINAYTRCSSDEEAGRLLTSISYKRNGRQTNVVQASSEMLHKFFISTNPDLVLYTA